MKYTNKKNHQLKQIALDYHFFCYGKSRSDNLVNMKQYENLVFSFIF